MRKTVGYFENFTATRSNQKTERHVSCKLSLCVEHNFWILDTGARWKDVPKDPNFDSKSTAHR